MGNHTPTSSFTTSHTTNPSQTPISSTLLSEISPASLDTLPILTAILTRLQTGTTTSSSSTTLGLTQNGSPHVSQSQTLQAASTSSPLPSTAATSKEHLQTGPLSTKDIPAATDDLKSGLKKARAVIMQLPDMDRGVEEQEAEIWELEKRIVEQRRVLEGLKAMGGGGVAET